MTWTPRTGGWYNFKGKAIHWEGNGLYAWAEGGDFTPAYYRCKTILGAELAAQVGQELYYVSADDLEGRPNG